MSQSFNPEGIKFFWHIVSSGKSLAIPHFYVKDINSIDPRRLKYYGIEGVIFDKDNTLTAPYENQIHPAVRAAFSRFQSVFGDEIVIMSNSVGTKDDKNYEAAKEIEAALGVQVLRHERKKPEGIVAVKKRFRCPPTRLAMIGDRPFTDNAFGNRHGMVTVQTDPLTKKGDNKVAAIVRIYERFLIGRWRRRGVTAPPHELCHPDIRLEGLV